MSEKETRSAQAGHDLRRQAEEIIGEKATASPENLEAMSLQETRQLLHEMRAHQIELETQNEELRRVYTALSNISEHRRTEEELKEAHQYLEQKVQERTQELVDTNKMLLSEMQERMKSEAILRESEKKYRYIYNNAMGGIYQSTPDGRSLVVNPAAARMCGYDSPEEITAKVSDIAQQLYVYPEERARLLSLVTQHGNIEKFETQFYKKDGSKMWVSLSTRLVKDAEGNVLHCEGMIEDVTNRKQAEQDRIAREVAEAANRAKSVFVANMSHEIRTPMNIIMGFAQLLERDPSLTPQQVEHVRVITHSGRHLMRLIGNILDMSKIEFGRMTIQETAFSLSNLLDDLDTIFRSHVNAKGLQFLMEREQSLPHYVTADENKLRQVLVNLIGNAVKFTETGGVVVRVRAEAGEGKTVQTQEALRLLVEVEDSGPGIPEEEMGRIFNAFQQATDGVKEGGIGLGLAISHNLVEIMGGQLTVSSQVGQGSCFRFQAPIKPAKEVAAREQAASRRIVDLETDSESFRISVAGDATPNHALPGKHEIPDHAQPASLTSEALNALPKEMVTAMRQAVEEGDIAHLGRLIAQVEKIDGPTAHGLQALANRYDYQKLSQWLGINDELFEKRSPK